MNTYDEIPYESNPITETQPIRLAVHGRLFGLNTPDPEHCRVLELGCAGGGNIVPLAWYHPQSEFVGVERAGSQARAGVELIAQLNLKNLEIRQEDILNLDIDLGEFDYILVHGVYSWVPEVVRDKIMTLCAAHLSKHGVAYISYNTLPGWRMRGILRDILLYHTRNISNSLQKLEFARDLVKHLDTALEGLDTYHARYLKMEIKHLRSAHPSYLYHEYMEDINQPFLFTRFMEHANNAGLQYLCDVDLQAMFPSTLTEEAQGLIEAFDDLIEQEQYIDFIRNRNFRQTLLCHADRSLEREVALERFEHMAFYSDLASPKKIDIRRLKQSTFTASSGRKFPVSHPLTKAALIYLREVFPDSVPFVTLQTEAERRLCVAGCMQYMGQYDHLGSELFSLYAHQAIGASPYKRCFFNKITQQPQATALARTQASNKLGHLATARHAIIQLDAFSTHLVNYLDGSLTQAELVDRLTGDVLSGKLGIDFKGVQLSKPEQVRTQIAANCQRLLTLFAANGILQDTIN